MSVSGISNNNLFELLEAQNNQAQGTQAQNSQNNSPQQIQDDFTQLGQDLQSGNLTQAQQDFATLSTALSAPQATANSATSNSSSSNPIQQAFSALQQDLQNGNLSAAQADFANLEQALQQGLQQTGSQHHHHHEKETDGQFHFRISLYIGPFMKTNHFQQAHSHHVYFVTLLVS